jgi:Protein of unknown function (DUF3309)
MSFSSRASSQKGSNLFSACSNAACPGSTGDFNGAAYTQSESLARIKGKPKEPMQTILLIILLLLLIGALPTWPYSTGWGFYPSGGLGLVLVIVLLVVLLR